jgi:hypothetical protein
LDEKRKNNYNHPNNTLNLDKNFDKKILEAFASDLIEEANNKEMKKPNSAMWKRILSTKSKEPDFYKMLKDIIKDKYSSLSEVQKRNLTNLLRKE